MTVDWSQQGQVGRLTLNNPQRKIFLADYT